MNWWRVHTPDAHPPTGYIPNSDTAQSDPGKDPPKQFFALAPARWALDLPGNSEGESAQFEPGQAFSDGLTDKGSLGDKQVTR
jgi:hypothetical protein